TRRRQHVEILALGAVGRWVEGEARRRGSARHRTNDARRGSHFGRGMVSVGAEGDQASVGGDAELPVREQYGYAADRLAIADIPDIAGAMDRRRGEVDRAAE